MRAMSKNQFKRMVSNAINKIAFSNLIDKAKSQSKCSGILNNIDQEKISIQKYLITEHLFKEEQELLFMLRCKAFQVKNNFGYKYEDMTCRACKKADTLEDENHLCTTCSTFEEKRDGLALQIEDIYGGLNVQIQFIKKFKVIARKWKLILELKTTM